jgi:hypothetical protein
MGLIEVPSWDLLGETEVNHLIFYVSPVFEPRFEPSYSRIKIYSVTAALTYSVFISEYKVRASALVVVEGGIETTWRLRCGVGFPNKTTADYCLVTSDRAQIQGLFEKLTVAKLLKKLFLYYRTLLITTEYRRVYIRVT